jgi:signal transduction histidine kinase
VAGRRRYRTWTVFLVALCSLLALMLIPSFSALNRSQQIYREIREIQEQYERSQRALEALTRNFYLISIVIREFFLDTSPENGRMYLGQFQQSRREIEARLDELKSLGRAEERTVLLQLQREIDNYWTAIIPVFDWTPRQRVEQGTYFLRQEQRPRRQSIFAITEEIARLNGAFYRQQSERVNASEREFRQGLEWVMRVVFVAGILVAAASIFRIAWLERRAQQQQEQVARTGEELRSLSVRLRHAQEEERKTISRELHDEVGQKLTAMRMELGSLDRLRETGEGEFDERLKDVKDLAEQSLRIIRDIAAGLRPSVLDDLGLGPALQRQAREFSRSTGIPVSADVEGQVDQLPDQHRISIYRIVQESLTNCAKHAQARKIAVSLKGNSSELVLRIEDDGIGFDPRKATPAGIGLIGIEERVRELGGSVLIESKPGSGTRVEVTISQNGSTA